MGTTFEWLGFLGAVFSLIALDLYLVRRRGGSMPPASAVRWVLLYISLALGFAGYIYTQQGTKGAVTFLTAYVIEYALSIDNLFVFLVIFSYFKIRNQAQHRLLYWGVLGAFILRATLIGLGTTLVARFTWLLYLFGAFLLYTAYKLLFSGGDEEVDPEKNPVLKWARKHLPVATQDHGLKFFTRENGRNVVTSLFLVLLVVETTDLLFAFDSIPAVLGISKDPFLVFTSNVAAVMGLRSLFFVVASLMDKFHYLKVGLGIILAFVGFKLMGETYFAEQVHEHEWLLVGGSLGFVALTLLLSVVASVVWPPKTARKTHDV